MSERARCDGRRVSSLVRCALLAGLSLVVGACSRAPDAASVAGVDKRPSTTTLATFVELGSVNCIPCKMMQPIMREIEQQYAGQVSVVFHDVWTPAGEPYAKQYGIKVIPTQVFLDRNGQEYFRHEGFFPKEQLVAILKRQGVQ
jgi:thiol-disulfide isomerase/thioredoxin